MNRTFSTYGLVVVFLFAFGATARAQVDDMCREFGAMPSMDSPFAQVPYVFGRIVLKGMDSGGKLPRVTVILLDRNQSEKRLTITTSGNYCFRRTGGGGTLVIEVDGVETARRSLPSFGAAQQREDFEIHATASQRPVPPSTVSAKFSRPPNEKTAELYRKAAESERNKDIKAAIGHLKEIVSIDPADFIAWAKLGSLHFEQNELPEAEAAFRKSIELNQEYTPAWINMGKIRGVQKQPDAAIGIFKHVVSLDPESARGFQLLGEAYLQAKQGTLGVEALNQAIKLDPVGMAESHLMIARLYDLAGVKNLATREYKAFLAKVPEYADRKKLEKYIKDNPD